MEPDEKTCPFCAETIKAAAVICKHCGKAQETRTSEEIAESNSKENLKRSIADLKTSSSNLGRNLKGCGGCLFLIIIIFGAIGTCLPSADKKEDATSSVDKHPEIPTKITSTQIADNSPEPPKQSVLANNMAIDNKAENLKIFNALLISLGKNRPDILQRATPHNTQYANASAKNVYINLQYTNPESAKKNIHNDSQEVLLELISVMTESGVTPKSDYRLHCKGFVGEDPNSYQLFGGAAYYGGDEIVIED